MVGHTNGLQETLEEYLISLEKEAESLQLYNLLKDNSHRSMEANDLFEQAQIAQILYYERMISMREPIVLEQILKECNKTHEKDYSDIWTYLNILTEKTKFTWQEILSSIGMDSNLSRQIRARNMNLKRISPEKLVQIAQELEADTNILLRLCYKWFMQNRQTLSSTISYRSFQDTPMARPFEIGQEPDNTVYRYMEELEDLLL